MPARNTLRLCAAIALVLSALWPAPAHARPHVVRSLPGDGAVLAEAPALAQVWFSHGAAVELASVALVDVKGDAVRGASASVASYQPQQAGLEAQFDSTYLYLCSIGARALPTLLSVALPPLPEGSYRLSWRARGSDDSAPASGALVFAVRPGAAPTAPSPASTSMEVDGLLVTLAVSPNMPGQNFLLVSVADTRRPARAPVREVALRLRRPGGASGAVLRAQPLGEGRFQIAGDLLPAPGDWGATITLRRPGLPDASAELVWSVPAPANVPPWLPWAIGGALAFLASLAVGPLLRLRVGAKEHP